MQLKSKIKKYLHKNLLDYNKKKEKTKTKEKLKALANMNGDKRAVKPKSFKLQILNLFHKFLVVIFRAIFILINGRHGTAMPAIKDLILTESATSLALKIRTKKLKSTQVMRSFIDRANEVNSLLNCVVDDCYDEALEEAEKVDKLIESGQFTVEQLARDKPFLGVPISTKDCIRVKGLLHTSGLTRRRNVRGDSDADTMDLMRKAGAIPFALTNVSECCMWWESYNKLHGRTRNPYDSNRIVGGSSGGEGCLQSAAGSPMGLGSDIGGSIRMPSFFNGVFGHKPSKFIVSNEGQYPRPATKEQDSFLGIGPICRYACDLKPIMQILADKNAPSLYLDEPVDLKSIKFYYQYDDGGSDLITPVDQEIKLALDKVVKHLKHTVKAEVNRVSISRLRKSAPIWFANMKSENQVGFDAQLANLDGKINVWLEMLKTLVGKSDHTLIALLTCITEKGGIKYDTPQYHHYVEEKKKLYQEFRDMVGTDGVFLYPVHPTVAPYHSEPIVRAFNFSYTGIFNILGVPATSIPLGLGVQGLPLGIQAVAGINQDRLCLAVAVELERAFGGWVPPEIQA